MGRAEIGLRLKILTQVQSTVPRSVGVGAKLWCLKIRPIFYIRNDSCVSSEHGLEPLSGSYQVFTLVCGKTCCLSFSSSAYQLLNLMLGSSLLARSCGWSPGNAGPAEHLCVLLEEMKIFHCGERIFPLSLILLSGFLSCARLLYL